MALIYSRPRIRLPKIWIMNNKKPSQNKKILKIWFILLTIIIVIFVIIKAVGPVFNKLCLSKWRNNKRNKKFWIFRLYNYS